MGCYKPNPHLSKKLDEEEFFQLLAALETKLALLYLNIENAQATRTLDGTKYIPKKAINCKRGVCEVVKLNSENSATLRYDPKHPDANNKGYVSYPNVDVMSQMSEVVKLQRVKESLMKVAPVGESYFYSKEATHYFKKYPILDKTYNFQKIINR